MVQESTNLLGVVEVCHNCQMVWVGELDRLGLWGPKPMLLGDLMWFSERLFIQPVLGETGCIYHRQVRLPIGFAWLCERW